jgi:hypothetical protein
MIHTEPYLQQIEQWPKRGRHILAQYDGDGVVVYQAYRPAIGHFAASNQYFGGDFKLSRMSWIKPNFLWMMYRCGWGLKNDQEVVLAITICREGFEAILAQAVHSSFDASLYGEYNSWKERLARSSVRLQWDPDHDPKGVKQERRAIQLGMSGSVLESYSREWIIRIDDISDFVAQQRTHAFEDGYANLQTPTERVYQVMNLETKRHLEIDDAENLAT